MAAKDRQYDCEARWTKKNQETYYGNKTLNPRADNLHRASIAFAATSQGFSSHYLRALVKRTKFSQVSIPQMIAESEMKICDPKGLRVALLLRGYRTF